MSNNSSLIVICVVLIGLSVFLFSTRNENCPATFNALKYTSLTVKNKKDNAILATITIENNKLAVQSGDPEITDFFNTNRDKIEQTEYSLPIGGRCKGAFWDGIQKAKIGDGMFLVGVEKDMAKIFQAREDNGSIEIKLIK